MQFDTLLAAYVTTNSSDLSTVFDAQKGLADFTPAFREWCLTHSNECLFEYINVFPTHDNFFELTDCSDGETHQANTWLRENFGVVRDAGHVAALCELMSKHAKASAVMINTLRYANHTTWHTLTPATTVFSKLWAQFRIRHGT